jgi:dynein heavy chain
VLPQQIIFGDTSNRPMNDLSVMLDEIFYPMLNNPVNQEGWPDVIKKDVETQVQDLRNLLAEVTNLIKCLYYERLKWKIT